MSYTSCEKGFAHTQKCGTYVELKTMSHIDLTKIINPIKKSAFGPKTKKF
jgi:hypothetical protein